MAKEKERRFILKYLPENLGSQIIKQAYLMLDGNQHLRVRITDGKPELGFKIFHSFEERTEFEYEIPLNDALEMFDTAKYKLDKRRYSTVFEGNKVHIDIYASGKKTVEVEFENELKNIPPYCGEEITGVNGWSNIWIAMNEPYIEIN